MRSVRQPKLTKGVFATALAIALIIFLAPPEKTLGDIAKVIYLHAALVWAGTIVFTVSGVLGLVHLITGSRLIAERTSALYKVGIIFWVSNIVLSVFSMELAWGAILWQEPRFAIVIKILGFVLVGVLVKMIGRRLELDSLVSVLVAAVLWYLLINAKVIIHPVNAITGSDVLAVKLTTLGMLVALLVLAYQLMISFCRPQSRYQRIKLIT